MGRQTALLSLLSAATACRQPRGHGSLARFCRSASPILSRRAPSSVLGTNLSGAYTSSRLRRTRRSSGLQDSSGSSTACWRVLSLQLTSDRSSSQCAPVRPSSAGWNDIENDIPPLHPTPCRSNVALGRAGASGPPRPLAPPNRAPAASSTERGRHRRNAESLRPDTSRLTCLCVQGERQLERIGEHLGSLSWLRLALIRPRLHEQRLLRVGSSVDFEPA